MREIARFGKQSFTSAQYDYPNYQNGNNQVENALKVYPMLQNPGANPVTIVMIHLKDKASVNHPSISKGGRAKKIV